MANNIEIIDEEEEGYLDLVIDDVGNQKESKEINEGGEVVIISKNEAEDDNEMIDVGGVEDASASVTVDISSESEGETPATNPTLPSSSQTIRKRLKTYGESLAKKGIKRKSNGVELEEEWDSQPKVTKVVFPSDEFREKQLRNLKEKHRRTGIIDLFMKLQGLLIQSSENLWAKNLILARALRHITEMKRIGNQMRIDIDRLMSDNCRLRFKYLKLIRDKTPTEPLEYPEFLFSDSSKLGPAPPSIKRRKSDSSLNGTEDKPAKKEVGLIPFSSATSSDCTVQLSENVTVKTVPSSKKSQASSLVCRRLSDGSLTNLIIEVKGNPPGPSRISRTISADGASTSEMKSLSSGIYRIDRKESNGLPKLKGPKNGSSLKKNVSSKRAVVKLEAPSCSKNISPSNVVIPSSSSTLADESGLRLETIELLSSDDEM